MTALLSAVEIQTKLESLNGWQQEGKTIQTVKTFDGFPSAIAFVNKLVEPAETAGHHPDLSISYNKVTIALSTHDAGGLTQKDFDLAATIDKLAT
ncbi:4a-hydroxytetrahydrobiopterin dehydratase [Leptolyngbya iicbica]|uniref:Putative pterin-4-alpha-carbinolamine dehydratase n=2 Tax=Cyanophyceae TaxID=3028117 RepID=A0A4Q7EHP9_9CYAN|nr:4a-hydroxytetrahydrobiopterin dehydratase [Leptolyngbya sp. LK]RZM82873.1 4a-hydroxytetrahydrobiopterin dehydratase [Leptolyngbya sp. LK]